MTDTDDTIPSGIIQRPPGVYFNLPEEDYHSDKALGSSDIRRLAISPPDFWFGSRFNPLREPAGDPTEAQRVGTAMHLLILKGRQAFEARYAPVHHPGNIKAGKTEREEIYARRMEPIKFDVYARLLQTGAMIAGNEFLRDAFDNPIGTEVSVFWTDRRTGMPKKCRFDAVKPKSLVDLKSIVGRDDKDFPAQCMSHIAGYRYDVQALHYLDGWAEVARLMGEGAVFGADDDQAIVRLQRASGRALSTFIFVFVQKNGAPLTWATMLTPGNEGIFGPARATISVAEQNWLTFSKRHGLDKPWVDPQPIKELFVDEMPAWYGRHH